MEKPRLILLFALILVLILALGILFWPFVLANIVTPVALLVWVLLRILVLSIDQKILWALLAFSALVFILRRVSHEVRIPEQYGPLEGNTTLKKVELWRHFIQFSPDEVGEHEAIQRELSRMLVSLYTTRQSSSTFMEVNEALKERQIHLPDPIYAFLFSSRAAAAPRRSFKQALGALFRASQRYFHRWTGRESADYYRSIDAVLTFLETSLEMKNDDGHNDLPER